MEAHDVQLAGDIHTRDRRRCFQLRRHPALRRPGAEPPSEPERSGAPFRCLQRLNRSAAGFTWAITQPDSLVLVVAAGVDQLVETARLAGMRMLLIQELQPAFVQDREELVPRDRLEL